MNQVSPKNIGSSKNLLLTQTKINKLGTTKNNKSFDQQSLNFTKNEKRAKILNQTSGLIKKKDNIHETMPAMTTEYIT